MEATAPKSRTISSRKSIIALLLFLAFTVYNCVNSWQKDEINEDLKQQVLAKDSIQKVDDGHYTKLINDLNSEKELNRILTANNEDLASELRKAGKKPIIYIQSESTFKPQSDTVAVDKTKPNDFIAYYPKVDPFITFTRTYQNDSTAVNDWKFGTLAIDIVVSETATKGLFSTDIKGADFLIVKSIEVNSLPLTPVIPNNFDWVMGGSIMVDPSNFKVLPQVSGGIRWKKTIYIVQSTGQFHGAGLLKQF